MRKLIIVILILSIIAANFTSCSYSDGAENEKAESATIMLCEPRDKYTFYFESYDEVRDALTMPTSEAYRAFRAEKDYGKQDYGEVFNKTLSAFEDGSIQLVVPQLNGENMKLQDKEGLVKINFSTNDGFKLPWLWYHCLVDGKLVRVKISYISVLENKDIEAAKSFVEIMSIISPKSPTPDNAEKYAYYSAIYEKEIQLADGQTVTAMVSKEKDRSRVYYDMYVDGRLILIFGDESHFTDDFWSSFSLVPY